MSSSTAGSRRPRVVVLGAGYAGLMTAKQVARRSNAQVTVINERDRFVERVRLHQLASGQRLPDLPLRELLDGTGIELIVDRVIAIDPDDRSVRVEGSTDPVPYDYLVYALGSGPDKDAVPGVAEHAFAIGAPDDAARLADRLRHDEHTTVAVVGGGLTGIEAATEIAESHPRATVRLVTGEPFGDRLSAAGRRHLHRTFDRLGIDIVENATVVKVGPDGVVLGDDTTVDADAVVWTTGFRVPGLAREAGLTVDDNGRMVVDESLRSVSHPEVYGVGDAAAARMPNGGPELRMACATGLPSAVYVARGIARRLRGQQEKPLKYRFFN
ncbi:MAG TPA: FAD-dependent oxidoreductase, partial [Actinopolymorphaceae bacterium]